MVYPDGEILSYAYDTGGQLKSVTGVKGTEEYNYVKSITYDAFGQRTKIALGNGDVSTYTYDKATRRLMNLQTKNLSACPALSQLFYRVSTADNIHYAVSCDLKSSCSYAVDETKIPSGRCSPVTFGM